MPGGERGHPPTPRAPGAQAAAESSPDARSARRRTYNRRTGDQDPSPPYFEVFERIASALERIEVLIRGGQVTMPDVEARRPANR